MSFEDGLQEEELRSLEYRTDVIPTGAAWENAQRGEWNEKTKTATRKDWAMYLVNTEWQSWCLSEPIKAQDKQTIGGQWENWRRNMEESAHQFSVYSTYKACTSCA